MKIFIAIFYSSIIIFKDIILLLLLIVLLVIYLIQPQNYILQKQENMDIIYENLILIIFIICNKKDSQNYLI